MERINMIKSRRRKGIRLNCLALGVICIWGCLLHHQTVCLLIAPQCASASDTPIAVPQQHNIAVVNVYHPTWTRPFNLTADEAMTLGLGMGQLSASAWTISSDKVLDNIFNLDNVGNLAWGMGVHQLLDGHTYKPDRDLVYEHENILKDANTNSLTVLVMGMGPILDTGTNPKRMNAKLERMKSFVEAVQGPILIFGMGVESSVENCSDDLAPEAKALLLFLHESMEQKGGYVTLRGACTHEMIARAGIPMKHYPVMGCPTYFLNSHPALGMRLEKKYQTLVERIENKTSTGCLKVGVLTLGYDSMEGVTQFVRKYSCKEGSMHLTQGKADFKIAQGVQKIIGPDIHITSKLFYDMHTWQSEVQDLDIVIGPRIHGSMVPLSVEVPTVTTRADNRISELCDTMGLVCYSAGTAEDFQERILGAMKQFNGAMFDANRNAKAAKYLEMFQEAGLTLNEDVAALADLHVGMGR